MTPGLIAASQKCVDCANAHRVTVEFLEQLVKVEPAWAGPVAELRSKIDHASEVGQTTIALAEQFQNR